MSAKAAHVCESGDERTFTLSIAAYASPFANESPTCAGLVRLVRRSMGIRSIEAHIGQVYVDDIAELFLREVGDSRLCRPCCLNPLVLARVLEVGREVREAANGCTRHWPEWLHKYQPRTFDMRAVAARARAKGNDTGYGSPVGRGRKRSWRKNGRLTSGGGPPQSRAAGPGNTCT